MSPAKVRMLAAAFGAVVSLVAIVVLLMQGPPSKRVEPTLPGQADEFAPAAQDNALTPRPTRERPVAVRPGLDGLPPIASVLGSQGWKLALTGVEGQALEAEVPMAFAKALGIGEGPVWVHVVAAWCLPCLWELGTFFDSAKPMLAGGGRVVAAVIDAPGTSPAEAEAGLAAIVAARNQLPETDEVEVPKGLVAVADPQRYINDVGDLLVESAAKLRPQGIPLSIVFDACGAPRLVVQNRHDGATFRAIATMMEGLAKERTACPSPAAD